MDDIPPVGGQFKPPSKRAYQRKVEGSLAGSGSSYSSRTPFDGENADYGFLDADGMMNPSAVRGNPRKRSRGSEEESQPNQPVSFEELTRKVKNNKGASSLTKQCWGCMHGVLNKDFGESASIKESFQTISDIIRHYAFKIQLEELMMMIKTVFDEEIAVNCRPDAHGKRPEWSLEEITEHFLCHCREPTLEIRKKIDDFDIVYTTLRDNLFSIDPSTGKPVADEKSVRSMNQVAEVIRKLYTFDTSRSPAFIQGVTEIPDFRKNRSSGGFGKS